MSELPRRENGVTVRYIAQTIISQPHVGIEKFIEKLSNKHGVSKTKFENLESYFFLHLEDYEVGDKSEIDFILWNEYVIIPVEVKAFTDANSPDVKKEIIRNYFHIREMKNSSQFFFTKTQEIYPVLLFSNSYQNWKRKGNSTFDYFNENFLLKKGENQKVDMDNWGKGGYPIPKRYYDNSNFSKDIKIINRDLFFITWDDIYSIHIELNTDSVFTNKIYELENLKDYIQDNNSGIPLVNK